MLKFNTSNIHPGQMKEASEGRQVCASTRCRRDGRETEKSFYSAEKSVLSMFIEKSECFGPQKVLQEMNVFYEMPCLKKLSMWHWIIGKMIRFCCSHHQMCCWACPGTVRAAMGPWRDQRWFFLVTGLSRPPSWIWEGPVTLASPRPSSVMTSFPMTSSSLALAVMKKRVEMMVKHSPHVC